MAAPPDVPLPPSHTFRFDSLEAEDLSDDASFIFVDASTEPRGALPVWRQLSSRSPERCVVVKSQSRDSIHVAIGGETRDVFLSDGVGLTALSASQHIYVDVSGLSHHVWAPLLRVFLEAGRCVRVVYAEPRSYRSHPSPASPTLFDLSNSYGGLAPLPGFARLQEPPEPSKTVFVPLLGFEGNRPLQIAWHFDPVPVVVPIVGVPGFRLEYPEFTIACNRDFLEESRAYGNIRLARASCPFEAYEALSDIRKDFPDHFIHVAPVGTKPHAIGAIKFVIDNPDSTELMYDHPARKAGRTDGVGLVHIYEFS